MHVYIYTCTKEHNKTFLYKNKIDLMVTQHIKMYY
jgi:hypothetical protein